MLSTTLLPWSDQIFFKMLSFQFIHEKPMDFTHFHFFSISSFSPPPFLLVCEFGQELPMDSDVSFCLLSVRS